MTKKIYFFILFILLAVNIYPQLDIAQDYDATFTVKDVSGNKVIINSKVDSGAYLYLATDTAIVVSFNISKNYRIKEIIEPQGEIFAKDLVLRNGGEYTFILDKEVRDGFKLEISYQLCIEETGVCLIPKKANISYGEVPENIEMNENIVSQGQSTDILGNLSDKIEGTNSILLIILLCFLAGILSFLLPCVYPLIPITIGYIVPSTANVSKKSRFISALIFCSGIVITYTLLGVIVSILGRFINLQFGSLAYKPYILIPLLLFFLYFTFSMFNFYEFKIPRFLFGIKDKTYKKDASYREKLIMGMITGLVASPCVGPVVATILSIALLNPSVGYIYLFFYGLGFVSVLLVLATFSSLLTKIPKSGGWMRIIQSIFALLMSGFTIYYLDILLYVLGVRMHTIYIALAIYAIISVVVILVRYKHFDDYLKSQALNSMIVITLFISAATLFFGVRSNISYDAQVPAQDRYTVFSNVAKTYEEALEISKNTGKPILIDFNAVWCKNCKVLEEKALLVSPLKDLISEEFIFISIDVDVDKESAKKYSIKTLPYIIIIDSDENKLYERNKFGVFNEKLMMTLHFEFETILNNN